jgi:hypothetical protein
MHNFTFSGMPFPVFFCGKKIPPITHCDTVAAPGPKFFRFISFFLLLRFTLATRGYLNYCHRFSFPALRCSCTACSAASLSDAPMTDES